MKTPPTLIAVEDLFGAPTRSRALLSPDGTTVAYLAPWRGRLNVFLRDLHSDWSLSDDVDPGARRITSDTRRNIGYLRYIGDPDDPHQAADMLGRSPISRVDDVTAPVLLVHGANDVRVARRHSDRIVEALRARGAEVEYLLNETEGHLFVNPDSNIELYRTLERFLARHLGARAFTTC